ncbi:MULTISPECIES: sigma-70 family RNA polymerase sigma factor [Flavobacterium]|uniref:Sigma-70 family RNA polymerase sigma factor n=1 Tax=Flavobacterium endoglycinae TaxID=2816357 RepID=A0ABX7QHL3_9FLAO|nr:MULTISPECIES: sigma-70 family RNA polymerase sigma factor [Flavobacterium]QSW89859.1 sigma-70 family RNA polymerase sigma factor [Flavobacterium endoglycinae]
MKNEIQNIWKDFHLELQKFIFLKVKNKEISEDILQDVFLKIQLNVHTLKDSSKLTSWVYQITRNSVIDHFRKNNSVLFLDNNDMAEDEVDLDFSRLSDCINSKINNLPDKYKQALLLTILKDFSQIELAEYLGISHSGAKSRVQRGKEKVKTQVLNCKNKDEMNLDDFSLQ